MPQSILVIGGTGHTGHSIVQKLKRHEYTARVLARDIESVRKRFDADVEVVEGDITQEAGVAAAMRGVAGCVVVVESSDSNQAPNSPERVHYEGARNVLTASAGHLVHIVLVSQIYITRPERYPEVRNVIHWRGQAEQALRASGQLYTIVRPGWLTDEPGGRVALRFEQRDRGEGQVCREDVAEACVQSLLIPEARGKTFELYNVPGQPLQDWSSAFRVLKADA